jgi:hypothetical protein
VAIDVTAPRSRRSLLASLVGGVAAAGAATLAGAQRVLGAGDDGAAIHVGDDHLDVRSETQLINKTNGNAVIRVGNRSNGKGIDAFTEGTGQAVFATTTSGTAVWGYGVNHVGVAALSRGGTGLWATHGETTSQSAGYPAAILAESDDKDGPAVIGNNYAKTGHGHGVQGLTDSPAGWATLGWARARGTAILGVSGSAFPASQVPPDTGVFGFAAQGRGGVFRGAKAQVRLVASSAATHPTTGALGDLFLDKNKRLWFCKGGSTWKQIA